MSFPDSHHGDHGDHSSMDREHIGHPQERTRGVAKAREIITFPGAIPGLDATEAYATDINDMAIRTSINPPLNPEHPSTAPAITLCNPDGHTLTLPAKDFQFCPTDYDEHAYLQTTLEPTSAELWEQHRFNMTFTSRYHHVNRAGGFNNLGEIDQQAVFAIRNHEAMLGVESMLEMFRLQVKAAEYHGRDASLADLYERLRRVVDGMEVLPQPGQTLRQEKI